MSTRVLSRWTLGATVLLVALGGFTRGSGSGYGCADRWPLCEDGLLGGLLPRADYHMIIEWSHRWLAGLVGLLAVATAVTAWRHSRRWLGWAAVAVIGVIGVQAWVGRLVVVGNLDADLVSVHLAISMTVVALLAVIVAATSHSAGTNPDAGWVLRFAVGALLSMAVLMLGSLVHNVYVPGWPLVLGSVVPDLTSRTIAIHFLHRVFAATASGYVVWLAWRVRSSHRSQQERLLAYAAVATVVVNVGLGAAHVFTRVESAALVSGHLGVAALAWAALVAAAALAAGPGDPALT